MIKHVWSVMAERICRDQEGDSVSHLVTIEDVFSTDLPITQNQMSLASRWHKTGSQAESFKFRVGVIFPDESRKSLIASPKLRFGVKSPDYRTTIGFNGYEFDQWGLHIFQVEQSSGNEWTMVAELPIIVRKVPTVEETKKKSLQKKRMRK